MADIKKTIEIESKGFRELQQELKKTKDLLAETSDPKELAKLSKQAADLKSEMEDLNDEVKAFQGSKFEQVSGQFGRVGKSIKNLDFAKAATQAKTLATMTKSISFKEVISGAKNFGKTLLNLGKAIIANPLFLLAAVVTAIVFAIYKWMEATGAIQVVMDALSAALDAVIGWIKDGVNWIGDMVDKFDQLGTGVKIVIGIFAGPFMAAIYAVTKALKFFGVIDDEETRKLKKLNKEKIDAINKQRDEFVKAQNKKIEKLKEESDVYQDELDFQLKLAQAEGKNVEGITREILNAKKEALEEEKKLIFERVVAETKANLEILRLQGQTSELIAGIYNGISKSIEEEGGFEAFVTKAIGGSEEFAEVEKNLKKTEQDIQIFEATVTTAKREASKERMATDKAEADAAIAEAKRVRDKKFALLQQQIDEAKRVRDEYNERRLNQEEREIEGLRKREEDELNILIAAKDAEVALQQLRLDEGLISIEDYEQEKLRIESDFSEFSKSITEETEKAKQEIRDKYAAIEQEKIDDIKARLEGETLETELAALQSKFDLEYEIIKDNEELVLALKEEYGAKIDSVNEKYDNEELKRKMALADKINELAQKGLKYANLINDVFSKENDKSAKRNFEINKAASIATATTDGYKAVMSTFADAPGGPILKGIQAAISGRFAAITIAKLKKSKYQSSGGGGGGSISIPSVPSTPMTSVDSASPSFNLFGQNNNQNNLSSSSPMEVGGGPTVIKAIVSETDISQTSERLSKIKQMSEN